MKLPVIKEFLFIFIVIIACCGKDKAKRDNPFDPEGTNFIGWQAPVLSGPLIAWYNYILTWTDMYADAYLIEESQDSTFTNPLRFTTNATNKLFTHNTQNETYYYRVRTNTGNKDSNWSNTVVITINGNASNVTMVSIPGDTFQMGDVEDAGSSDEKPVHSVTLTGFEMSVHEITNAQYCAYLISAKASGDITATSASVKGAQGDYNGEEYIFLAGYNSLYPDARCWIIFSDNTFTVASGKENYPAVFVTWYGAKACALYYGLDLPTEAEWEYACRGGLQHKYGTEDDTISSVNANYNLNNGHPVDAGSYPSNPYGLNDMSGNVWEWCNDWYGEYLSDSVTDPAGPSIGTYRVIRGGSWSSSEFDCRSAVRLAISQFGRYDNIGFRVVRRVSS